MTKVDRWRRSCSRKGYELLTFNDEDFFEETKKKLDKKNVEFFDFGGKRDLGLYVPRAIANEICEEV